MVLFCSRAYRRSLPCSPGSSGFGSGLLAAKIVKDSLKVVPLGGHGGVGGAQGGLGDGQGLLVLGAGAGEVPEVLEHAAEVVAPEADVGVGGAQGGLADGQGLLVL